MAAKPLREFIALFDEIWHLIDKVDTRCAEADGPVTPTHEEIHPHEVKQILEKLDCMAALQPRLYEGRKGQIIADMEKTIEELEETVNELRRENEEVHAERLAAEKRATELQRLQVESDDDTPLPARKPKTKPHDTYRLLHEGNAADLAASVGRALREGWRPLGGVAVSPGTWAQAMVKRC